MDPQINSCLFSYIFSSMYAMFTLRVEQFIWPPIKASHTSGLSPRWRITAGSSTALYQSHMDRKGFYDRILSLWFYSVRIWCFRERSLTPADPRGIQTMWCVMWCVVPCANVTWSRGMSRMLGMLFLRYWQKQCSNSFVSYCF